MGRKGRATLITSKRGFLSIVVGRQLHDRGIRGMFISKTDDGYPKSPVHDQLLRIYICALRSMLFQFRPRIRDPSCNLLLETSKGFQNSLPITPFEPWRGARPSDPWIRS